MLYEITGLFRELFDRFDEINNYTPDTDAEGRYIDGNGDIIEDLNAYREWLLKGWFDTVSMLEDEFTDKAENLAVYIKNLNAQISEMKKEEAILKKRRAAFEISVDRLKAHLLSSMEAVGLKKLDLPRVRISIKNNAESLVVDDELGFIKWAQENADELLKYSAPEIRKSDTKRLVQGGRSIPCVHLTRTKSVIIK